MQNVFTQRFTQSDLGSMSVRIGRREIGPQFPVYIIAEMSANHGQDFDKAVQILEAAKSSGADAIKLQTYKPSTMTIDCDKPDFRVSGTVWDGQNLYDLYGEAYTPWEWHPRLKDVATDLGLDFFSTPFDDTAVDFLEELGVPAYKIASFEIVDLPLLRKVARTGKPVILSTGMATLSEIDEAVETLKDEGAENIVLLKCTSAYPASADAMNLLTISHMSETFKVVAGLSDHTLDVAVPVTAVALGASVIEKHLTLDRSVPGPDSAFSLEPQEFREMVAAVRTTESALGSVDYGLSEREAASKVFRRSLFVVNDVRAGELFTGENVRLIRPGTGLHSRYFPDVLGRRARLDISRGTPLSWDLVGGCQDNSRSGQ